MYCKFLLSFFTFNVRSILINTDSNKLIGDKLTVNEDYLDNALNYQANTFASTSFENLGNGKFKSSQLPSLAQVSSINAICIDDVDNDGHEDK